MTSKRVNDQYLNLNKRPRSYSTITIPGDILRIISSHLDPLSFEAFRQSCNRVRDALSVYKKKAITK